MAAKEMLNNEVRITVLRALMGLLVTASLAAGSAYMAMRDQVIRSEEWVKIVGAQMIEQNKKLDDLTLKLYGLMAQLSESNQRLSRLEGVLSVRDRTQ